MGSYRALLAASEAMIFYRDLEPLFQLRTDAESIENRKGVTNVGQTAFVGRRF
jgi:hypothetical protein